MAEYQIKVEGKIIKVPYHLIDVVSPKKQFTLADWQRLAKEKIIKVQKRGHLPIICGGTGLYISSIVEDYQLPAVGKNKKEIRAIKNRLTKLTLKQLLARLRKIDFKTYQLIDKQNRRRVQRALEIYYQTGLTKSVQLKKKKSSLDILQLGLNLPRAVLYSKIDQRLKIWLEKEGLIEEVKKLRAKGIAWQRLEDFGLTYRWVARYLKGKIDYPTMFEELKKDLHHYAKRQITWFRRDKKIRWIDDYLTVRELVKNWLK